jgi:hypothetical protein
MTNKHNSWRDKPAASKRPLDPGSGGRPSTPIGRNQVIKSSVGSDPNSQGGLGPRGSSLLDQDGFGHRDLLKSDIGARVTMVAGGDAPSGHATDDDGEPNV